MFLLFGGENDFNIQAIDKQLQNLNIDHTSIIIQENQVPTLYWDMDTGAFFINGRPIKASSVFLRDDVFNSVTSNNKLSYSWYTALRNWALIHDDVKMFNKHYKGMNKAYNLAIAKSIGFDVPQTIVSNQMKELAKFKRIKEHIVKPINGGKYTRNIKDYLSETKSSKKNHACVSFIQNELIQPEMRIFGIGNSFHAFWIKSNLLDYREDKRTQIFPCAAPLHLSKKLSSLMQKLKLDFAAADFKTCPKTKKLIFLEINSGPMFGRFDYHCKGVLSRAIINWHLKQDEIKHIPTGHLIHN